MKKSRSAVSSEVLVSPVASKTRPLYFSAASVDAVEAMPRRSRIPGSDSARRPVPPTATVPSTSGSPSTYRSSGTGFGSPRFLTSSWPIGVCTKPW